MYDEILHASDLLQEGESAVAVTTDGTHLVIEPDGAGETGNWKADSDRRPRKVIIYRAVAPGLDYAAEVYLADFSRWRPSNEDGRFIIDFLNAKRVGVTSEGWKAFASASQNPVRYLEAPR